jgi:hypothetical protein
LVSHTIPSIMHAGQSLFVGLTWRNLGEGPWSTLCFDHGLALTFDDCGMVLGDPPILLPMLGDAATPPGQTYQFIAQLRAPDAPGPCVLRWRMNEPAPLTSTLSFGAEAEITLQVVIPPNAAPNWEAYE